MNYGNFPDNINSQRTNIHTQNTHHPELMLPHNRNNWPPKQDDVEKDKIYVYVLDSRDRNTVKYPNPNKYQIQLSEEFKYVKSVELISAFVPASGYNITDKCNKLSIITNGGTLNGQTQNINITPGNYQNTDSSKDDYLAKAFNIQLNNINNELYLGYSNILNKTIFYTKFKSNVETNIELKFASGNTIKYDDDNIPTYAVDSIGIKLGFNPINKNIGSNGVTFTKSINGNQISLSDERNQNLISKPILDAIKDVNSKVYFKIIKNKTYRFSINVDTIDDWANIPVEDAINDNITDQLTNTTVITNGTLYLPYILADNAINLQDDIYTLLEIPQFRRIESLDSSTSRSFAKIPLVPEIDFQNSINLGITKYFEPNLQRLSYLNISFLRYSKSYLSHETEYYDFNGREHVLTFAIICSKQPGNYTEIFK